MLLYASVIFLGAFLLFQIQPLIAKIILPHFGGSSVVWSTCMLFFQVVLLLGYAYAHWLNEHVRAKRQAILHATLLLLSLFVLPIGPDAARRIVGTGQPSWQILTLLVSTIGIPYFLLAATSPLMQAWFSRREGRIVPYRLYALSNLASMLALLTYPFLVEPNLTTRHQGWIWSIAYAGFAALCAGTAWGSARVPIETSRAPDAALVVAPGWGLRLLWMTLAACASILLLSVTNFLTSDVAAIPFLWVLPLSAYLLTFILCFDSPRLYFRPLFLPLLAAALPLMNYMLKRPTTAFPIAWTVFWSEMILFSCSMVCHGELVRLKPHPRHLTLFYTMLSLGGAIGGVFVALIAPTVFNGYQEFPIGLGLCAILAASMLVANYRGTLLRSWGLLGTVVIVALVGAYIVDLGKIVQSSIGGNLLTERNFYGQLRVRDEPDIYENVVHRKLLHGVIDHGEQILDPRYSRHPVSYFCRDSGVGKAMVAREGVRRRIGILGLGCGTLAAYGRPGDTIRIYEINPAVLEIAQHEFTYLKDTPAQIQTVIGDGRLSLEMEPSQQFDVLVMDAFSGDSVPVHLLTIEAVQTYWRHLKPNGILAVNVTNRHLDLRPVMERAAAHFDKVALLYAFNADEYDPLCLSADWVLMLDNSARGEYPSLFSSGTPLKEYSGFRPWTDDFSNMFRILK
jgi:SAM-dependent methyltransferase